MNYWCLIFGKILIISLFITIIETRMGRRPDRMDQTLCKVQMYSALDKIQEEEDPRASVEAYFNRTGYGCKTYCKIRSLNKELNQIMVIYNSPIYVICGIERYCDEGKCKRIGPVIKQHKQVKEMPQNQVKPKGNDTEKALEKDYKNEE